MNPYDPSWHETAKRTCRFHPSGCPEFIPAPGFKGWWGECAGCGEILTGPLPDENGMLYGMQVNPHRCQTPERCFIAGSMIYNKSR